MSRPKDGLLKIFAYVGAITVVTVLCLLLLPEEWALRVVFGFLSLGLVVASARLRLPAKERAPVMSALLKMLGYAGIVVGVAGLCMSIFGATAGAFVFVALLLLWGIGWLAQIATRSISKGGNSEIGRAILHGLIIRKINRRS